MTISPNRIEHARQALSAAASKRLLRTGLREWEIEAILTADDAWRAEHTQGDEVWKPWLDSCEGK